MGNILQDSNILQNRLMGQDLVNWMKLTRVKGLGPKKMQNLLFSFKSIDKIMTAPSSELVASGIFSQEMAEQLEQLKKASDENFFNAIDACEKNGITIITLFDGLYPERLRNTQSPPLMLFLLGDEKLLSNEKNIAVVGSRKAGKTALEFTYETSKELTKQGFGIISGGALGVDSAAHKAALDANAKTICVLGTGFFKLYPEENTALFESIRKKGLLVSEHLPNFPGSRFSFLQRNRITSGLSSAVLVCAGEEKRSGTSTQASIAVSQGKPIFCPEPKLFESEPSEREGISYIIKEFKATTVPEDPVLAAKRIAGLLPSFKARKPAQTRLV